MRISHPVQVRRINPGRDTAGLAAMSSSTTAGAEGVGVSLSEELSPAAIFLWMRGMTLPEQVWLSWKRFERYRALPSCPFSLVTRFVHTRSGAPRENDG